MIEKNNVVKKNREKGVILINRQKKKRFAEGKKLYRRMEGKIWLCNIRKRIKSNEVRKRA